MNKTDTLGSQALQAKKSSPARIIAPVVGAMVGYLVVHALPHALAMRALFGGAAGLLVGLLPYLMARKQGRAGLASGALWGCGVSGAILGLLLAIPVSLILAIAVFATRPQQVR